VISPMKGLKRCLRKVIKASFEKGAAAFILAEAAGVENSRSDDLASNLVVVGAVCR